MNETLDIDKEYEEFINKLKEDTNSKKVFDDFIITTYLLDNIDKIIDSALRTILLEFDTVDKNIGIRENLILLLVISDIENQLSATSNDMVYQIFYRYVTDVIAGIDDATTI